MGTLETRDDIVASIKKLGLTEYEARILVALLQSEPSTAYELAKKSGVPRPNTYSALEALEDRGAVMPVNEKPVRYVAKDPTQFFGRIASTTQTICEDITTKLSALAAPERDIYVWNLRGEEEVHQSVAALIEAATTDIWVKGDHELLDRHKDALREAAIDRGISLMVILFGTKPQAYRFTENCRIFVHEASGVRMGSADNLFTLVADQTEMLTANREEIVRGAHTQNQAVVKMALSLIRHDYYMAEIFQRFKTELDDCFGPHLSELRHNSYTPDQIKSFHDKISIEDHANFEATMRRSK